jgi:hypothetical protein
VNFETTTVKYEEGDTVIIEYRDPGGQYVADVALLNGNTVRYIFEVKQSHITTTVRPEPWFEIPTDYILDCQFKQGHSITLKCVRETHNRNRICRVCKMFNISQPDWILALKNEHEQAKREIDLLKMEVERLRCQKNKIKVTSSHPREKGEMYYARARPITYPNATYAPSSPPTPLLSRHSKNKTQCWEYSLLPVVQEQTRAGECRAKEICVCVWNDVPLVVIRYASSVMVRQEQKSGCTKSITYAPQVIDLKPEHVPPSTSPDPSSLEPNQNLSAHEQVVDTCYETWLKKNNEAARNGWAGMDNKPPTAKQLIFLKSLGCPETPKSMIECSALIDKYK